jgi:carboxylesterase type B
VNDVLRCLREKPAADLTLKQWDIVLNAIGTAFPPTADMLHFIQGDPIELVRQGQFKKTSLMMGSNLHEGSFFMLYGRMDLFPFKNKSEITPLQVDSGIGLMSRGT